MATEQPAPGAPFWRRPVIFDVERGMRRLFWNELTWAQRFAELEDQARRNRALLTERFHR